MLRVTVRVLMLFGLMMTGGCAAVLIGGAAAGGYVVAKDERSAAEIAEDSAITAAVKARFIADKYVAAGDVNVDTYLSVVTMTGEVSSFVSRDQAERIASRVRGVESVKNDLIVIER